MISHRTPTRRPTREERAFFESLVAMRERYAATAVGEARELIDLRLAVAAANAEMRRVVASPAPRRLGIDAN